MSGFTRKETKKSKDAQKEAIELNREDYDRFLQQGYKETGDVSKDWLAYDTWSGQQYGSQPTIEDIRKAKTSEAIAGLTEEQKTLMDKSKKTEATYKSGLLRQSDATMGAIDRALASLIDQTGFTAGLTKQAVGGNMASAGLLRSGQTASKLQGVDVRKASAVTDLTGQRNQQITKVKNTRDSAIKTVDDRRTQIQNQLKMAEISGLKDLAYQEQQMKINMEMKQYITDLGLSSMNTKAMMDALGSLGQMAGIGIGYYANATPPTGQTDYTGTPGTYGSEGYTYGYGEGSQNNMA